MAVNAWHRFACRWLSLCGVVPPILVALVNAFVAREQPHFHPLQDYVSDMSEPSAPYSTVVRAWWMAFPFLFGPFAAAVYAVTRGRKFALVTPVLLFVFALGIGGCGVFYFDPSHPWRDSTSRAHFIVSTLASAALFPCPLFFWLSMRGDPEWQSYQSFHLGIQAAGLINGFLLVLAFLYLAPKGLAESAYWITYYVWILAVALTIFKSCHRNYRSTGRDRT